jgi:2,4'-dihydroxyacetophenone dioxygenase
MKSSSDQLQAAEHRSIDQSKIAYQKPQPPGMVPDVFVGSALELDGDPLCMSAVANFSLNRS